MPRNAAGSGSHRDEALAISSMRLRLLLAITFLYPVILCAVFFPTPAADLREHIALGLTFPLYTPRNPPLPSWLAGAIALTGARDAWLFVLVAQVLNFMGLAYLVRTARRFIGAEAVLPLIIMFCGSIYYSGATPSMALNADQIAVAIWAGFLYHALLAARDNRWRDWLLTGAFIGLALLAKYYAIVLLGVYLATAALLPSYRVIFVNYRFYVAGLTAAAIASVNVVPQLLHSNALEYGVARFALDATLAERAGAVWQLLRSFVIYGLPALIGLGCLAWRSEVARPRMPDEPAPKFMVLAAVGMALVMLLMIAFGGLRYSTRYAYPFFGLWLLAVLALIPVEPRGLRSYANTMLGIWAGIIVGSLVYTQVVIHRVFREPAPAASAMLRQAWDHQYSCGPAYVLGDTLTARGIAIYFSRRIGAIAFEEVDFPNWFDKDRLRRLGGIVISTPDKLGAQEYSRYFAGKSPATIILPYRRTLQSPQHTYQYYFIPPEGCSTRVKRPSAEDPPATPIG